MKFSQTALLLALIYEGFAVPLSRGQSPSAAGQGTAQSGADAAIQAANRAFQEGYAAAQRNDPQAAKLSFQQAVQLAPQIAVGHGALGSTLLALGDSSGAIRELEEARRLDQNDTTTFLNLCIAYTKSNEFLKTIAVYHDLEAAARPGQNLPDALPADAAIAVATALSQTKATAEAQAVLEQALAAEASPGPDDARLQDALGTLLAQQGHYAEAAPHLERAVALDDTMAAAHFHLGEVEMAAGAPSNAVVELSRASVLQPAAISYTIALAQALIADRQEAKAITILKAALSRSASPEAADAVELRYRLALALQSSEDARQAVPLFDDVLKSRPEDAEALTNAGLSHVQVGDAKGGVPLYLRALKLRPSDPTLREDLGVAYLQQADLDHALEQFRAGLAMDSENPQLHYDLGLALKLKDDLAAAIPEFQRSSELDPQLADPPYTLGVIYMQQGRFQDAAASLERATVLRPENGDAWAILGSVYQQMQQPDKAVPALRKAISLLPSQPSPHINLAAILASKGQKEEAAAERRVGASLTRAAVNRQHAEFGLDSGNLLLKRGQTEEALVQFQSAVEADPGYAATHLALATALDRAGRKSEAAEERRKAVQLATPGQP